MYSKHLSITNPDEIKELMQVFRSDIYDESYEEMTERREPWAEVELLMYDNKRVHSTWLKTFERTEKWLKEKGYFEHRSI